MDKAHLYHDEQKKPDTEKHKLQESIHMKFKNRQNKSCCWKSQ